MTNNQQSQHPAATATATPATATPVAANGQLTPLQILEAKIAELTAQLAAKGTGAVSFKCYAKGEKYVDSQGVTREGKGVMSMYGFGQFPISLYGTQWRTMIGAVKDGSIERALESFKVKLATK